MSVPEITRKFLLDHPLPVEQAAQLPVFGVDCVGFKGLEAGGFGKGRLAHGFVR